MEFRYFIGLTILLLHFPSVSGRAISELCSYNNEQDSDVENHNEDCQVGNIGLGETTRVKRSATAGVNITAYLRGKVYTVDKTDSTWHTNVQQAIVIKNGVIEYVGNNARAEAILYEYYNQSSDNEFTIYDLNGATVLPGFHDIHMHPLEAGSVVGGTCQLTKNTDPEQFISTIQQCAPNQVGTNWVLGGGHSISSILDHISSGGRAPRLILDEAVPDKPAVMLEETSHSVWVNSEALYQANIDNTTQPRAGGIIMREPDSLQPNGILIENEAILVMDQAMTPTATLDQYNYDGLLIGLGTIAENGITSVCDSRLFTVRDHQEAWQTACDNGRLTARVILQLWASPSADDTTQIAALKALYSDDTSTCLLRKTNIKIYSDGILDSTTAAMLAPYDYNISLPGLEENVGMNYFDQTRIERYLSELQTFDTTKHFDFNIHAIGDRGITECLNAFNSTYESGTRHRLTHVEVVDTSDFGRFGALDVIADFQVAGEFTLPSGRAHVESLIGSSRADNYIPVKDIIDAGGFTTFSSDWDVSQINPFVGIEHATQRGDQSVTVKTAIEMYTANPAFAMRQDDVVGSLITGKEADLVIMDQDILSIATTKISDTNVLQTVLQGNPVYTRTGSLNVVEDVSSDYMNNYCPNNFCIYTSTTESHSPPRSCSNFLVFAAILLSIFISSK